MHNGSHNPGRDPKAPVWGQPVLASGDKPRIARIPPRMAALLDEMAEFHCCNLTKVVQDACRLYLRHHGKMPR